MSELDLMRLMDYLDERYRASRGAQQDSKKTEAWLQFIVVVERHWPAISDLARAAMGMKAS